MNAVRLTFAGLLGLAGCAAGSGIVAVGPDTYFVSEMRAPALGGGVEAQRVVVAESHAFCAQQSRQAIVIAMQPEGDPFTPYWPTAFGATFRCDRPAAPPAVDAPRP